MRQLVVGTNGASVLALQEAGTPPASAQRQGDLGECPISFKTVAIKSVLLALSS